MADSSEHEETRRILKRPKKWTKTDRFNIVSQPNYYDQDLEACKHFRQFEYVYSQCLKYRELRRKLPWTEEKRRKTTSTTTHKYWYRGGYEYGQTTSPPPYATVTRPPLPPPPVVYRAEPPPAPSHGFVSLIMVENLVPLTLVFLTVAVCVYVIIEFCKERKPASVQRRPEGVQTTPLLPGVRSETQESTVLLASHEPLRTVISRPTNNDLPPPYSECVRSGTGKSEEPPPRYSACFLNLEEAEPQVHIRGRNVFDERAHSSTDIGNENGIRAKSPASSNQSEDVAPRRRT